MKTEQNTFGVLSLIFGIMGFIFLFPISNILAIIFGAIGLKNNEKYAKTGFTLGIVSLIGGIILITIFVFMWLGIVFTSLSAFV